LLDLIVLAAKIHKRIEKTKNNATDLSNKAFVLINIVFVLTDIDAVLTLGRHFAPFRTAPKNLLHGTSQF